MQDGEKHGRLRIFRKAGIFPVFYNAYHLYARTLGLVIFAHRIGCGAKDFAGKLAVDHCHAWRALVVVPRESPARQQGRPGRIEVSGRYVVNHGFRSGVRWPQIARLVDEDIGAVRAVIQGQAIDQSHGFYAGNSLQSIDHALLHGGQRVTAVAGHIQSCLHQQCIPRLKSETAV